MFLLVKLRQKLLRNHGGCHVAVAASFEALAAADADGSETAIVGNVEKEMPNPANQEILSKFEWKLKRLSISRTCQLFGNFQRM